MTLTEADIVDVLVQEQYLNQKNAEKFVDAFFKELVSTLENGYDIKLSGFGNFTLRDKVARPGRNPKTGEDKIISARRVVTFKAGDKLKKYVQMNLEKKNG